MPPSSIHTDTGLHQYLFWRALNFFVLPVICALYFTVIARAADPLVSAEWLDANLTSSGIKILDLQPPQGYMRVHLPGAVNTQYGVWRQRKPVSGKSLPDIPYLEEQLGAMGISNKDHIILTPLGVSANEIAVATRIYWTLKVLGHEQVSILNGGLIAYSKLTKPNFTNKPAKITPATYKANPNLSMAPSAQDVLKAWEAGISFVDYRSPSEFMGRDNSPRPGTIPGSKNLPFDLFVEPKQGGKFLDIASIKSLYQRAQIKTDTDEIAFCNSGHRASLAWFVASELLGNKKVRLYDGSMAEWSQFPDYPISVPEK